MKQKSRYQRELEKEPYYNIKDEEFGKEVKFKIDKSSFRGPFRCHGKNTALIDKKTSYGDIEFAYKVWQCKRCRKEYVDLEQAKKYEKFIIIKKLLEDKLITIERNINYDGKAYFFRFPKELTSDWSKDDVADIKLLSPEGKMFLVEIKSG